MGKIRSRLVPFTVTAKDTNSDTPDSWVRWEISFQGNRIPEERREWLAMAHTGGFRDIKLTRVTSATKRQKADIAAQGLAILDAIVAGRKGDKS